MHLVGNLVGARQDLILDALICISQLVEMLVSFFTTLATPILPKGVAEQPLLFFHFFFHFFNSLILFFLSFIIFNFLIFKVFYFQFFVCLFLFLFFNAYKMCQHLRVDTWTTISCWTKIWTEVPSPSFPIVQVPFVIKIKAHGTKIELYFDTDDT